MWLDVNLPGLVCVQVSGAGVCWGGHGLVMTGTRGRRGWEYGTGWGRRGTGPGYVQADVGENVQQWHRAQTHTYTHTITYSHGHIRVEEGKGILLEGIIIIWQWGEGETGRVTQRDSAQRTQKKEHKGMCEFGHWVYTETVQTGTRGKASEWGGGERKKVRSTRVLMREKKQKGEHTRAYRHTGLAGLVEKNRALTLPRVSVLQVNYKNRTNRMMIPPPNHKLC